MSPFTELLPFVFLGIVIGVFLPAGNISTSRGVRPLSLPYAGESLRSRPFVAGFMANFLDLIGRLVAGLRSATIIQYDLNTTSLRRIFSGAESAATAAPAQPYDILRSEAQALGWAGLERASFDVLADLEDSLDAQPFEPVYIQYYVTTFLFVILSHPNAIAPGVRATITDHLVSNESDLFNDEYLPLFTSSNNLIVAQFIIATGNQISPVIIGILHLAWSDPAVAQTLLKFSYSPSWDRYNRHLSNSPSVSQIAHSVHCQSPVWASEIPASLSDVEVEFIAALFAVAVFTFHYGSFAVVK